MRLVCRRCDVAWGHVAVDDRVPCWLCGDEGEGLTPGGKGGLHRPDGVSMSDATLEAHLSKCWHCLTPGVVPVARQVGLCDPCLVGLAA